MADWAVSCGKNSEGENPMDGSGMKQGRKGCEKQTPEELRKLERGRCWARQTQGDQARNAMSLNGKESL
jgi:hypothetical protein